MAQNWLICLYWLICFFFWAKTAKVRSRGRTLKKRVRSRRCTKNAIAPSHDCAVTVFCDCAVAVWPTLPDKNGRSLYIWPYQTKMVGVRSLIQSYLYDKPCILWYITYHTGTLEVPVCGTNLSLALVRFQGIFISLQSSQLTHHVLHAFYACVYEVTLRSPSMVCLSYTQPVYVVNLLPTYTYT